MLKKTAQYGLLALCDVGHRLRLGEPTTPIHFQKALQPSGFRRPDHFEAVGNHSFVGSQPPSTAHAELFAIRFTECAERAERILCREVRFFSELAHAASR